MILLGCLVAFGLAVAPRFFLVLAWLFSERWAIVWRGDFVVPLLGIIFLPFTTIMYMLTGPRQDFRAGIGCGSSLASSSI